MQKAVLKLELQGHKEKKKALKIASGFGGVESVTVDMTERKLTVIGHMDPVEVAGKLRKLFPTEIVSLGPAKEDKPKVPTINPEKPPDSCWLLTPLPPPHPDHCHCWCPHHCVCLGRNISIEENPNACVIC